MMNCGVFSRLSAWKFRHRLLSILFPRSMQRYRCSCTNELPGGLTARRMRKLSPSLSPLLYAHFRTLRVVRWQATTLEPYPFYFAVSTCNRDCVFLTSGLDGEIPRSL